MAYVSTWDDTGNILSHLELVKMMKEEFSLQFPLTTFVNSGHFNASRIDAFKRLLSRGAGDRLESHTVNHNHLDKIDPYIEDQAWIRKTFGCEHASTLSYPHGHIPTSRATRIHLRTMYQGARTIAFGLYDQTSHDEMYLPCVEIQSVTREILDKAMLRGAAVITYGHGISGGDWASGWHPVHLDKMRRHLKDLSVLRDQIWFTTLPELLSYLRKTGQIITKKNVVEYSKGETC